MANTFKFGNKNWAWKEGSVLAYNDENNNFKPLPFDFTRSSSATRVNKDGLIEVVGSDEPRVDYLNNADGHLLLEPSRSNLFPYSNAAIAGGLTNLSAGTSSVAVTNNYAISPDGTQNAIRLEATCGNTISDRAGLRDLLTAAAVDSTFSFYGKSNTGSNQVMAIHFTGGTATTVTLTNEWQRFEYTGLSNTSNYVGVEIRGTITDLSVDVLLYGFQFEQGSYATSYIPTSGSSVTRAVDGDTQSLNIPNPPSAYPFVMYGEAYHTSGIASGAFGFYDTANRFAYYAVRFLSNNKITASSRPQSTVDNQIESTSTYAEGFHKVAVLFLNNTTMKLYVNGELIGTKTDCTTNTFNTGFNDYIVGNFRSLETNPCSIKDFRIYNTELSNAELIALTS